jgi:beta-galactosidase
MARLRAAPAIAAALLATALASAAAATAAGRPRRFTVAGDAFLLDGRPFQLISGALHYWRSHPDQWGDRLARAKALGARHGVSLADFL